MVIARAAPKVIPDDTAVPLFIFASSILFYVAPQRTSREAGQHGRRKSEEKGFLATNSLEPEAATCERKCSRIKGKLFYGLDLNSSQFVYIRGKKVLSL